MKVNLSQRVFLLVGFLVLINSGLQTAFAYRSNEYVNKGGCYLQKEYNYFMNQWTTNEVCRPKFVERPVQEVIANPNTSRATDNIYMGESTHEPVRYYNGPVLSQTGNNWNSWNGYGNAANYLLGSFGGGVGSSGYNSYYYPNYYTNALYTYYPTTYFSSYYYDDWYPDNSYSVTYCPDCSYSDLVAGATYDTTFFDW